MKKPNIIRLLLTVGLISSLVLTGCGGDKPKDAAAPSNNAPSSASPSASPQNQKTPDEKEQVSSIISKGKEIKEMYYEMVMVGAGLSTESKIWLKENNFKADSVVNGERSVSIFNMSGGEVVTYMPAQNMAMKVKIEEYQGQDSTSPIDYIKELDKDDFSILGTETVNGLECKVISVSAEGSSMKQWISTKYGVVVKLEEDLNGQKVTMDFKNMKVGAGTVPDDVFKLPQGVEVMDINKMMQNTPGMKQP